MKVSGTHIVDSTSGIQRTLLLPNFVLVLHVDNTVSIFNKALNTTYCIETFKGIETELRIAGH